MVAGAPIRDEAAVIGAPLDLQLSPRMSLDLGYDGQIGRDGYQQSVQPRLQVQF